MRAQLATSLLLLAWLPCPGGVLEDLALLRDRCLCFAAGHTPTNPATVTLRNGLYAQSPSALPGQVDLAASGFSLAALPAAVANGVLSSNQALVIATNAAHEMLCDMIVGQDVSLIGLAIDNFLTSRAQNLILQDPAVRRTLHWIFPPQCQAAQGATSQFVTFSWASIPFAPFTLQESEALDGNWVGTTNASVCGGRHLAVSGRPVSQSSVLSAAYGGPVTAAPGTAPPDVV